MSKSLLIGYQNDVQSPPALEMNKGNIYLSKTSPACVAEAYLLQFQIDFFAFLRSRAEETVAFAGMLLSFVGRSSTHHSADQMVARSFELLSQALKSMAYEGFVEEDKIDSFNLPYYDAHAEEVRNVIQKEGSFLINHLEAFEINWYEDDINNCDYDELKKLSRGEQWSRTVRAVVEPMLESHFGGGIMDELFSRHGKLVEDNLLRTRPKLINLMISVTRKP
ncbi:hypothetical protein BUALT_Bualt12G0115100 [Buddleja alternifolia]|uniref:Uncharacterized protein n=1 Tax=Buddleja alternifolia TaxID=168488 RepID=A0AAV6WQE0_9LAMI|nr:hypothetical protein BUALT_Bualt12G0115100 [Buddleja alternifolia]